MMNGEYSRRKFLHDAVLHSAATVAAASAIPIATAQSVAAVPSRGVPMRPLGKTGVNVSMIALGGWHIGRCGLDAGEKEATRIIHRAIDQGVTFLDNAWDYHDGYSEELMGKALKGRRDNVFLMSKICHQDYEGAKRDLEQSLKRLQTDRLDLWQFHEVNYPSDPDYAFDRGGFKAAREALKAGKVRFVGFTGHHRPDVHLKMLAKEFPWSTVQMPINCADHFYFSFQKQVLPQCTERGIGVIGMKSLGGSYPQAMLLQHPGLTPTLCRHYALSLPIASLVCGITSMAQLDEALEMARSFKPLSAEKKAEILAIVKPVAQDGRFEKFKSSDQFDGHTQKRLNTFATS